jgi:2-amino-4-hydroxy-6-hydroxymethyldihydropteridine diphosphokinase
MKNYIYHLIIGSNLGDREGLLMQAKNLIDAEIGNIKGESLIYETQPWGHEDQPWFLNQVLKVSTPIKPTTVIRQIKEIETRTGRLPGEKWHARHIDIDILLCDDLIIREDDLAIPHPLLATRNFVLVPLMELSPEIMHPVLEKTIEDLYLDSRDTGEVYIFNADEHGDSV